ncbi:MAG: hypothetical protein JXQ87_01155 [Bacteroidia bacterium]
MSDNANSGKLNLETFETFFILKLHNPEQCAENGLVDANRKTSDGETTDWAAIIEFGPQKGVDATELVTSKLLEVLVPKSMCVNPNADAVNRKYTLLLFDKENQRKPIQGLSRNDFQRKIGPKISGMRNYRHLVAGARVEFPNKAENKNPDPKTGMVTQLLDMTELRGFPPNSADVAWIV